MHGTPHIVSDVMTHTVAAVGRRATFKEIVRLMQDWKVGALPVLEGEGRVVGVVSEADLLPKEEFRDSDPDRDTQLRRLSDLAKAGAVTAEELMTSPALTVRPDATLARAARTMAHSKVKRLPVVNELGMLEGIVSRSDLLKVFLRGDEEIAEEVRREVVSYLFPAPASAIRVDVHDGVVNLAGRVRDRSLVPVAARLARAVEGVVDVDFELERREDSGGSIPVRGTGTRPSDQPGRSPGTRAVGP
ncbi:CBS domain-containing protein [Streptomyces lincolnensis]|uniref:CBS domain-containing protein n=1 Tax=Streptomyces lincolnensis TaxID=1915 RepID=A0A1B1MNL0_STRLN|nr:CBS domain-containing protein [Streptomyces lincolnensis]ANS70200.1 CBS domain-containing protein [Streptomyces lincolnensis]